MNGEVVSGARDIDIPFEGLSSSGFAEDDAGRFVSSYRDLEVWKEGMSLATDIYRTTASFPREELYGMTSQMRRASVSIPANIAEGYGRETTGAFIQFLRIAQGSLKELETLVELSKQLDFLSVGVFESLNSKVVRQSKMLRGLIRSLERRAKS